MIKVSIIVPIYNTEQYLSECINSILNQTFQDIEVILINDGSTDNSLKLCRKYEESDERITVLDQENAGSTNARRAGLKIAKGEYISFIDSDDWMESCFYEKLYELAESNQADLVVSGCTVEDNSKTFIKRNQLEEGAYKKNELKSKIYPQMLYFEQPTGYEFGIQQYLWNKLYKRPIIESCIENLDENIYDGEDVACVFDACLRASSIVIDNHPYYHYRIRKNSICTSKRDERYFVNAVNLYQYMERVFRNSDEYIVMMPQLKMFINYFINNGSKTVFGYEYMKSNAAAYWTLPEISTKERCAVAIFGAGNVGKSYYKQLLDMENIDIAVWVDSVNYGKRIGGVNIQCPDTLLESYWDFILIAVKNPKNAEEIVIWLNRNGVGDEKIIYKKPEKRIDLYEIK